MKAVNIVTIILISIMGGLLAYMGYDFTTWQFWIIILLANAAILIAQLAVIGGGEK